MIPERVLGGIRQLEPLPALAQALLASLHRGGETPTAEITRLLRQDGAVASRIVAVLNSPLYAGRYPMETAEEAVLRFGVAPILDVLLTDNFRRSRLDAPLYGLKGDEVWLHGTIGSLAVIEVIRENPRKEIPRIASVAALIHDIGKMLMVKYFDARSEELDILCQRQDITFAEAERRKFGCNHAEVGAAMATYWGFPESVSEAIGNHHEAPLPDPNAMTDAVALANLVAKTIGIGLGREGMNFQIDSGCYTRLGLDFNAFCRVCARTALSLGALKQAYLVSN
ncbi:MAG: HDOD domain-containing protein [Acidobacteria bacterium]|nr:MAG: HDOD domain-containing protein [Acidobacteriota bacterium]